MLLSYKMSPTYWPYVLDIRGFTFRQGQKFFSSPKRPERHVCSTRVPSWSGHGNVLCVFIQRRSQFLRLYGVDGEWINKCEEFVECCWQRESEVYLLGDKPIPLPLCPSQVPRGLACDRTQASAVGMKRLRRLLRCLYVVYSMYYD
jgi:hypothetical protein